MRYPAAEKLEIIRLVEPMMLCFRFEDAPVNLQSDCNDVRF